MHVLNGHRKETKTNATKTRHQLGKLGLWLPTSRFKKDLDRVTEMATVLVEDPAYNCL